MKKKCYGSNPELRDGRRIPISKAVRAGNTVYISGQVPVGPDGQIVSSGFEDQVHQVMKNIEKVLAEVEFSLSDVVKCNVWLEDVRNFDLFNSVYREYFSENPPARSVVHSLLMAPVGIEIEAIAYKMDQT